MTIELGLILILAAVTIGSIVSRVRAGKKIGKLETELAALRATAGAQTDAIAKMSQIPDTEAGAKRIHDAAKARAEKAKKKR